MTTSSVKSHASILVVDDDEIIQKMVSLMLSRAGFDVTVTGNGNEALAQVARAIPDLILADIMMPDMDGLELLRQLRSKPSTQAIPVIMLTAKGNTDDIVSGLNLGADDYLSKPFVMAELLARVQAKVARPPVPGDHLIQDRQTGLFSARMFAEEARREIERAARGGTPGCLAYLSLAELGSLTERFGRQAEAEIAKQAAGLMVGHANALDILGRDREGYFALLLPETNPETAERNLRVMAGEMMAHTFEIGGTRARLTPAVGYTVFSKGRDFDNLRDEALSAMDFAATQLDLEPKRYVPAIGPRASRSRPGRWENFRRSWRTPFHYFLTLLLGWIFPYFLYTWLDAIGRDISSTMYMVVVVSLFITTLLIWVEGFLALKVIHPPEEPAQPYPPATAIIAAYLPNEASTILETVEAFLSLEYPLPLQVILTYATPTDLPIEGILRDFQEREPRFRIFRVEGSTSKAQSVNAVLGEVRGEFVGIFDADHHPLPQSFMRAWRWLSSGYDVVQGHCQVRNGDASWVARMVAVEFEAIYAVSHPGRTRLYDFGVFGGSNGYWKTDLLRQTRLRGFMLTEDIDSSLRITEAGHRIASDPLLVSREMAPLTLKALWHQRLRWAQGWYQVSLRHFWGALRSRSLSLRQKSGIVWLLGWREVYPWIAVQMFPLIVFWAVKYGGLDKLDWLIPVFVMTTLFTLTVGPGQVLFSYLLATPEIRRRKGWFFNYLLVSMFFYTEFKNTIGRIAQVKELMGERQWRVTPRGRVGGMNADGS
jgi:DNA-binding response OmpR family regulator/cellulose synthase/poly-beta-1,6-N-acetylglucosamine synthase-like glycosyltransferase